MGSSICLCYTKENGLFTKYLGENEGQDMVLIRSHNEKWKKTLKATIPETNSTIEIRSKIGPHFYSFFYATLRVGDRIMLDFDKTKLQVLNGSGVERITAPFGDWNRLFNKIIRLYKESLCGFCTTSSIGYVDEIQSIIEKKQISIFGEFDDKHTTLWNGEYEVMMYVADKIENLLNQLQPAHIVDETFHQHCFSLCHNYLDKFADLGIDLDDTRLYHFSNALLAIHNYMFWQKKGDVFLKYYLNKQ